MDHQTFLITTEEQYTATTIYTLTTPTLKTIMQMTGEEQYTPTAMFTLQIDMALPSSQTTKLMTITVEQSTV